MLFSEVRATKEASKNFVTKLSSIEYILLNSLKVKTALPDSILYPVDKDWMADLDCYIKKHTRSYSEDLSCNLFPRQLSVSDKENNDYILETVWNALVSSFGVSKGNDLTRIFVTSSSRDSTMYASDQILAKIDIMRSLHDKTNVGKISGSLAFSAERISRLYYDAAAPSL